MGSRRDSWQDGLARPQRPPRAAPLGWRGYLRAIGPGVVSGAADTDPTTVATLAIVGAGTVYGLAWLTLLLFPMIAIIQVISTHVGVAGRGDLQTIVSTHYHRARWPLLVSVLAVNIVTIGADLQGGAAAIGLLVNLDWRWFVLPLSLLLLAALLLGPYHRVERALKYLVLCMLAYAAAALLAHADWAAVLRGSFVPHFEWNGEYLADALSLLGTTLTSYVYVWQTIAQSEHQTPWHRLRANKLDAIVGSFFAVIVFWFILISAGATLGVHHLHADTAAEAAESLQPIAGPAAGALFSVGLLASAVVALPVLLATTAYVTGAQMQWRRGLALKITEAPLFYAALATAGLLGTIIAFSGVSPIRLLFLAGIAGGIGTPVGLGLLLAAAGNPAAMGARPLPRPLLIAGWMVAAVMSVLSLAYLVQQIVSGP